MQASAGMLTGEGEIQEVENTCGETPGNQVAGKAFFSGSGEEDYGVENRPQPWSPMHGSPSMSSPASAVSQASLFLEEDDRIELDCEPTGESLPSLAIAIVRATEIAVNDAAGTEAVLWCRARVRQVTDMGKPSDADTPNRYLADRPATEESIWSPIEKSVEWREVFLLPVEDPSTAQIHILVFSSGIDDDKKSVVGEVLLDISKLLEYQNKAVEIQSDILANAFYPPTGAKYEVSVGKLTIRLTLEIPADVITVKRSKSTGGINERRKMDFHASLKGRAHASVENSTHNLERLEGTCVTFKGTDETGVFDNPWSIGAAPLYSVLLFVDRIHVQQDHHKLWGDVWLEVHLDGVPVSISRRCLGREMDFSQEQMMIPGVTGLPKNHDSLLTMHLFRESMFASKQKRPPYASCPLPLFPLLLSQKREVVVEFSLAKEETVAVHGSLRVRMDEPRQTLYKFMIPHHREFPFWVTDHDENELLHVRSCARNASEVSLSIDAARASMASESRASFNVEAAGKLSIPMSTTSNEINFQVPARSVISQGPVVEVHYATGLLAGWCQTDVTHGCHARTRVYDKDGTHWTTVKAIASKTLDHGKGVAFKMVQTFGDLSIQSVRDVECDGERPRRTSGNIIQLTRRRLTDPENPTEPGKLDLVGRITFRGGDQGIEVQVPDGKAVLLAITLAVGISEARKHRPLKLDEDQVVKEKAAAKRWKQNYGN